MACLVNCLTIVNFTFISGSRGELSRLSRMLEIVKRYPMFAVCAAACLGKDSVEKKVHIRTHKFN